MKRASVAATLAVLALGLTGCGGGTSGAPSTQGTSPGGTPASAPLPDLKGQTVEVAAVWTKEEQANFQKVLDDFASRTGATVKYTSTGDDIATVLGTRLAGGKAPDVAMIPQPGLIKQFVAKNALKELPAEATAAIEANYSPVWKDLGSVNGKPYAVFFKGANKSTMWYRAKAFQDAGISEPPKTWDAFVKDLQTLSDSGVQGPLAVGGADGWTLTDWFENVYLQTAGPQKYDQLTQHAIPWTDPSVRTALATLAQVWGNKQLLASAPLQTAFPDSVTKVFAGNAAVVYEGDFVAGVITSSTKAKVGTDAKVFPFPSVNGGSGVVGGGDAAVMMKDSPGAKALVTYLAQPESATIWARAGGFTSPNKNVPTDAYPDETSRQIAQELVSAPTFRFDMSDLAPAQFGATPGAGQWKHLQDFLANPKAIDATQRKLEADAVKAYK